MTRQTEIAPRLRWRKGQRLRPIVNGLIDQANTLATLTGGSATIVMRTPTAIAIDNDEPFKLAPQAFLAKLTDSDEGAHAWVEQMMVDGVASNKPGGRVGTLENLPAYEINGRMNVPEETLVFIAPIIVPDGSTQYIFDIATGTPGSEQDESHNGEHQLTALDGAGHAWDVELQTSYRGLKITLMTGARYDPADNSGAPVLYGYQRDFTFDANGNLKKVSTERRFEIDTPEACS